MTRYSIFSRPGGSLKRKETLSKRVAREQMLFLIHTGHYLRQCCAINTAVKPIKRRPRQRLLPLLFRRFYRQSFLPATCAPLDLAPLPTCRLMRRDRKRNRKESVVWFSGAVRRRRKRHRKRKEKREARESDVSR